MANSDDVSTALAGYDCVNYVYTLTHNDGVTDVTAYISINSSTGVITMQTDDLSLPGLTTETTVPIKVSLAFDNTDYSATHEELFNAVIETCPVDSTTFTGLSGSSYDVISGTVPDDIPI